MKTLLLSLRLSLIGLAIGLTGTGSALAQTTTVQSLPGRTIVKLVPDYLRPKLYALNSGAITGGAGSLVALDASTGAFLGELTLGPTPTDMDIEPAGQFLYVIHFGNNSITEVNLETFTLGRTRTFPPPDNHGSGSHYNLRAGRNNRLYWLDAKWAPALHIMDFSTGSEVGSYDSGEGFGDLAFSPDRSALYVWRQYGWNAGNINSWIWRLSINDDVVNIQDTSGIGFYRDPLDTPLLISGNGDRAFLKHRILYTTNLTAEALIFPNNDVIYSITYYGDVAFSTTKAYNSRNGDVLYTLPVATPIQAVAGDQQHLHLYNAASHEVVTIPMSDIAPVPSVTMTPTPIDRGTVSIPLPQLAWTWPPGAMSFRVYFGTNASEVSAATPSSPLYRGAVTSAAFLLTNTLTTSSTYYWRVDPVGINSVVTGPVWRFETAPVVVNPLLISVTTIASFNAATQALTISADGASKAWTLTENIPWLTASAASGVTPASLTLQFSTAGLAAGTYTENLTVASGPSSVVVPITLEVFPLDLVKMVADPARPYIYALQRPPAAGKTGAVLFINTDTEQIDQALPIVTDPRDLCVHPRENRLYVVDWLAGYLRVVDLNTRTSRPPLAVHGGLDRVNPGRSGRVIMEDWNQWIGIYAINTAITTNGIIGPLANLREGDGETSPDGRFYYHCDNNISSASVSKWDLSGDGFVQIGGGSTGHPYGSRNLHLSPDGARLFWQGCMYDTALSGPGGNVMQELACFGQQIWASTSNAWFAVGDSKVFDTRSQTAIYDLGISTSVKALSRDDRKLFQFDPTTKQLVVTPMATVLVPRITTHPDNATVLAGTTATFNAAVQGASPLTFQWLFNGEAISGANNLILTLTNVLNPRAGFYALRVSNPYGSATSSVARLTVMVPPVITRQPANLTAPAGTSATFGVVAGGTAPFGFQWQFEGTSLAGATNSTLTLANVQAASAGAYRVIVANPVGSATSPTAILRVLPGAPRFVQQPAGVVVSAGDTAVLTTGLIGSEPMSIAWYFRNAPQPAPNSPTLTITNVQGSHEGEYFCVASNAYGASTSTVALLSVTPRAPVIVTQPASRTVLAGTNTAFFVEVSGSDPIALQWRLNGTPLAGATNALLTLSNAQPANVGAYEAVAFNSFGAATSAVATLTVNLPARILQPPASRVAMVGDTVMFSAVVEGTAPLTVQWQFNGTNLDGATNVSLALAQLGFAQAGTYRVSVSNSFGNASAIVALSVLPRGGRLAAWGDNSAGQCHVPDWTNVLRVAGGNFHSLALRSDGTIGGWGDDGFGEATPPAGLSNVIAIAAGDGFSLALGAGQTVTAWGDNSSGQTNVPAAATNVVALAAGQAHALALRADGSVVSWGNNAHGQVQPAQLTDVTAIAAGEIHSLALRRNGRVIGWGNNAYGQAAPPPGLSGVIAIAAGYLHSLALRADGTVVAWGDNTFGQTAVPPNLSNVTAIAAGELHSTALRADGSVVTWGDNTFGQRDTPAAVVGALAVASGYYHQLAILPIPPVRLEFVARADGLVLWWNGAGTLQWAPGPAGPFQDLSATNPWTNRWAHGATGFYRLRRGP